jgi:hypothetical protein
VYQKAVPLILPIFTHHVLKMTLATHISIYWRVLVNDLWMMKEAGALKAFAMRRRGSIIKNEDPEISARRQLQIEN